MCGLAALWGQSDPGLTRAMIARQQHRGPDDSGMLELAGGAGTLGHCRLAVIDPACGQQPMVDPETGAALVANGMIYNDRALRERSPEARFRTASDSESILHSVGTRGGEAVQELDGMFAFVLARGDHLIAARDPVGIKPLYMARTGDGLVFASEAKAFAGLAADVAAFPPGHRYDSRTGFTRYYAIPDAPPADWDLDSALTAVRRTLEAAVVKRLRSDVPFGALLSGGLDSSIIAAIAARHVPDLKTFAVGLEGSADLAAARRVAAYLGTDHRERIVTPAEVSAALPRVLYHLESYDRDLVRSALPCWFVAEFAAREVTVVLTGEGADELFAGYGYYRDIADHAALHAELRRSIGTMHDINLQRVDRMTMAHGLEARVPFLDTAMIALGLSLPTGWKLMPGSGRRIEKWILRKAFADMLPDDIVWRDKLQFDQGSGFADLLADAAADAPPAHAAGRCAEEARYAALLAAEYADPGPIMALVSHWDTRPAAPQPAAE
ncbi:MAG: asparagine synthase-related protein [Alphaproteobacteria bacterium]